MKRLTILFTIFFIISCKTEKPQNIQTGEIDPSKFGVNVELKIAEKQLIGKWNLVRPSKLYSEFKLTRPADIIFKDDGTYIFNITLENKGKLSYKGKWKLQIQNNLLVLLLDRKQRAFESDWKDAEAKEGGFVRFINTEYKSAIINITNLVWHNPALNEDANNFWEKAVE